MAEPCRAIELKENSDYVSHLPDDILYQITSRLNVKDAAKTSILSKSWRYIWVNRHGFKLNFFTILGIDSKQLRKNWEGLDAVFVQSVDQIMQQTMKSGTTIKYFYLQFELRKKFFHYIDRWIYAIRKDLEFLTIDLSSFSFNMHLDSPERSDIYEFSLLRTVFENKGSLKHLRLVYCNFQCQSSFPKFDSLVSLELKDVDISNFQMTKVLESCRSLEKLIIFRCSTITNLRIDEGKNNHLQILSLKSLNLTEIDLCANNLISLEIEDVDTLRSFELMEFIKSCPLLEKLTLDTCMGLTYIKICDSNNAYIKDLSLKNCYFLNEIGLYVNNLRSLEYITKTSLLSSTIIAPRLVNAVISEVEPLHVTKSCLNFPMLGVLVLKMKLSLEFFMFQDNPLPKFSNVTRLDLYKFSLNVDESPSICHMLTCFPLLKTLVLFPRYKVKRDLEDTETKILENCSNETITKLMLNEYSGCGNQVNLIKYLLKNLKGLESLVISASGDQHPSLDWNWLYPIIPPSVGLTLL